MCQCILEPMAKKQLEDKFKSLAINPIQDPKTLEKSLENSRTITVEEVVSAEVCAVLCLGHDTADEFNFWHYQVNVKICNCGWVASMLCPMKMVAPNWTFDSDILSRTSNCSGDSIAFVQLMKTVPCGQSFLEILGKDGSPSCLVLFQIV